MESRVIKKLWCSEKTWVFFPMQRGQFLATTGRIPFIILNICPRGRILLYKLSHGCDLSRLNVFSLEFEGSESLFNLAVISSLAMAKTDRCTWIILLKFLARETICNLKIFKTIIFFWVRGISRFGAFPFFPTQTSHTCVRLSHPGLNFSRAYFTPREWMLKILVMAFINFTLKSCDMFQTH